MPVSNHVYDGPGEIDVEGARREFCWSIKTGIRTTDCIVGAQTEADLPNSAEIIHRGVERIIAGCGVTGCNNVVSVEHSQAPVA